MKSKQILEGMDPILGPTSSSCEGLRSKLFSLPANDDDDDDDDNNDCDEDDAFSKPVFFRIIIFDSQIE